MAPKLETWPILLLMLSFISLQYFVAAKPQVPCYFIFGDSAVDNGNNLALETIAKANFRPYGIDLPAGVPTGRFTNGRTSTDLLAELLGFKTFPPPYVTASGKEIMTGVNYGSSGAGIRRESGRNLGGRITMDKQLKQHLLISSKIADILGGDKELGARYLRKCIYSVTLGSNDYVNNYYIPAAYTTAVRFKPDQWAKLLIERYGMQLRTLYNFGARKIVIFSLERLGCAPVILALYGGRRDPDDTSCVESVNRAAELFNGRLIRLVDELNAELPDAKYVYVDLFTLKPTDLIPYGFKVVNSPCCKLPSGFVGLCIPRVAPCDDRDDYVFWDGYHTSEAVNKIIANKTYTAMSPHGVYPINIAQLAKLQI